MVEPSVLASIRRHRQVSGPLRSRIRESWCYPRAVSKPPPHAIECLKAAGQRSVWLIQRPGEALRTLKSWPLSPAMLLKLAMGIAQPQRQIRGTRRLAGAGVPTPAVAAAWRWARRGRWPVIELELEYVAGRCAMQGLTQSRGGDERLTRSARVIGRMVNTIASAGLLHRDLKLRNIIVVHADDHPQVWILDPVGVRRTADRVQAFLLMFDRLICEPVTEGTTLPAPLWKPVLQEALTGQPRTIRRAVFRRLRSHLQRRFDQWGVDGYGSRACRH